MVDLCRTKTCREALIFLLVAATLVMLASFNMVVNLTQAIQLHMLKSDDYWLSYPNIDYNQRGPKVIWLMSFPNSGNSFSTSLVRSYTNSVTATNYGENHLNEQGHSVPLHSGDQYKNGPFLVQTPLSQKSLIEKYVLTKVSTYTRPSLLQLIFFKLSSPDYWSDNIFIQIPRLIVEADVQDVPQHTTLRQKRPSR